MRLPISCLRLFGLVALLALIAFWSMGCVTYRHDLALYQNGKLLGEWKDLEVTRAQARTDNGKAVEILPAPGILLENGLCFRSGGVVILSRKSGQ